jgi:hypothetical protein
VDGWHKAIWDAALNQSNGHLGVGNVIRDQMGGVLLAKCMHMRGHMEPTASEAMAAYHSVRLSGLVRMLVSQISCWKGMRKMWWLL